MICKIIPMSYEIVSPSFDWNLVRLYLKSGKALKSRLKFLSREKGRKVLSRICLLLSLLENLKKGENPLSVLFKA